MQICVTRPQCVKEHRGSLLCSQKPATVPTAEPDGSSLHYIPYANSLKYFLILLYPHHRIGLLKVTFMQSFPIEIL